MLEFLIDNIFVVFGNQIFQHIAGIPNGINCAPLLAWSHPASRDPSKPNFTVDCSIYLNNTLILTTIFTQALEGLSLLLHVR
jgi:hypothetical protein